MSGQPRAENPERIFCAWADKSFFYPPSLSALATTMELEYKTVSQKGVVPNSVFQRSVNMSGFLRFLTPAVLLCAVVCLGACRPPPPPRDDPGYHRHHPHQKPHPGPVARPHPGPHPAPHSGPAVQPNHGPKPGPHPAVRPDNGHRPGHQPGARPGPGQRP